MFAVVLVCAEARSSLPSRRLMVNGSLRAIYVLQPDLTGEKPQGLECSSDKISDLIHLIIICFISLTAGERQKYRKTLTCKTIFMPVLNFSIMMTCYGCTVI